MTKYSPEETWQKIAELPASPASHSALRESVRERTTAEICDWMEWLMLWRKGASTAATRPGGEDTGRRLHMKAPFPYFGGKAKVAPVVWQALGDVAHYMEPFCGSCAVLLNRPDYDPTRHIETINDADGHIANVWRAITLAPDEVAKWCDWPVSHIDLIARKKALNEATEQLTDKLCADDAYYDSKLAGYYVWAASCWIGHGLIRPGQIPHLTDGGTGVHAKGARNASVKNENIYNWMRELSERLRYVRTICGDWSRMCGGDWQHNPGKPVGIFFDPPYGAKATRRKGLYSKDSLSVAEDVQKWCIERGGRDSYRIVLAGYYEEHEHLLEHGWMVHRWKAQGGYGNMGNGKGKKNRHREALFFSPHCVLQDEKGLFA